VLIKLANALCDECSFDESECFIGATFVPAKGCGDAPRQAKRGKSLIIMAIVCRHGLPLAVSTHAANHHDGYPGAAEF